MKLVAPWVLALLLAPLAGGSAAGVFPPNREGLAASVRGSDPATESLRTISEPPRQLHDAASHGGVRARERSILVAMREAATRGATERHPDGESSSEPELFNCARTSPSAAACRGCCNDEIALLTLGLAAVCPQLGLYGPAVCGAVVHLERRECAQRCDQAFPDPIPSESDTCGVEPELGVCRFACAPSEYQSYDYPCLGPFLKCCLPRLRFPW